MSENSLLKKCAFVLILLSLLSGCQRNTNTISVPNYDFSIVDHHMTTHMIKDDKEVLLDAEIVAPADLGNVNSITCEISENGFDQLSEDLVVSQYRDARFTHDNEIKSWRVLYGENLVVSVSMEPDGFITYTDKQRDFSGITTGNLFKYNSFIGDTPNSFSFTESDAIDQAIALIDKYSEFDFKPYRTYIECIDESTSRFRYRVNLQPVYSEIPVCIAGGNGKVMGCDVASGPDGVSWINGVFLLDNIRVAKSCSIMSPTELLDSLYRTIDILPFNDIAEINRVSLEYFATTKNNQLVQLKPVWVFYGVSDHIEDIRWLVAFDAETGSYCIQTSQLGA